MIIKRAKVSDLEEILLLQKIAYKSETEIYNDYSIPPLLQTLEEIEDEFKNSVFLKAVEIGEIIGSVRGKLINPETCYVGRLIVHPDFQNNYQRIKENASKRLKDSKSILDSSLRSS